MAQEWVYDDSIAGAAPLRLNEAPDAGAAGQGDVLVQACYIAMPASLSNARRGNSSVICGPVVGAVKHSSNPSLAVGDWVFAYGPWRTEFTADASNLTRIDTQLDDPLSYLGILGDDVVRLFASLQLIPRSNQDTACVFGADTPNGRIAAALLKALNFSVLALTENAPVHEQDELAGNLYCLADKNFATILQEASIDGFKVCVDCQGRELDEVCGAMLPDGLIVSWASRTSKLDLFDRLADAQVTFRALRPHSAGTVSGDLRSILRDIFRVHPPPSVIRVESGFEKIADLSAIQQSHEHIIVQVEDVLPAVPNTKVPEMIEGYRYLAEADIALRHFITDTKLRGSINQRQVALRTNLQNLARLNTQVRDQTTAESEADTKKSPLIAEQKVAAPAAAIPVLAPSAKFVPIESFAWDQGGYNSPSVTVYVDLPGVGAVKDSVTCRFDRDAFDLQISGLKGRNYRLRKDKLEKDIVPEESKIIVKPNKIVIKLKKVKGEFSYDHWSNLTAKNKRDTAAASKDPMGGIMDMMRNMYEEGDDQTRKLIAEAMMKAQRGEKEAPPSFDKL